MGNLRLIALNAFRESLREPLYFVMLFTALVTIAIFPCLTLFVFRQQVKMVLDSSLATAMVTGLLMVVLCAGSSIAREMRNGTVLLLLSKPVRRRDFILGKFFGVASAGVLFVTICHCGAVVSLHVATDEFYFKTWLFASFLGALGIAGIYGLFMNYWKGTSFSEYACYGAAVMVPVVLLIGVLAGDSPELSVRNTFAAMILIELAVLLMSAIAVALASRFDAVANLMLCSTLFIAGLISNYLFVRPSDSYLLKAVYNLCYALLPNWQYFWLTDAVSLGRTIPWSYVGFTALYTLIYIVFSLVWASGLFLTREAALDQS